MPYRFTLVPVAAAALLASLALAADPGPSLLKVPVASTRVVAPSEYAAATTLAAHGGAPIDIALAVVGTFEGATQHILQVNEGSEAPRASRVTVLRDGLLDDALRGERWDIALARSAAGVWRIEKVERTWRCRRGEHTDRFATTPCP